MGEYTRLAYRHAIGISHGHNMEADVLERSGNCRFAELSAARLEAVFYLRHCDARCHMLTPVYGCLYEHFSFGIWVAHDQYGDSKPFFAFADYLNRYRTGIRFFKRVDVFNHIRIGIHRAWGDDCCIIGQNHIRLPRRGRNHSVAPACRKCNGAQRKG
ncbi:hypothetical protein SDC9_164503 [bioreactor metagenome]|uniref:Uncharacterized protein n=1 Tax=bioreactor metagenome TaxID=1076179 RepID=A0A645FZ14_9ZZZZ